MNVRVQFFSRLRDIAGASTMELHLLDGAKVADLLDELYVRFPELRRWDGSILTGAGLDFVDGEYALSDDEEIALMPPVQGG